jgi:uncharacterized membrane protein
MNLDAVLLIAFGIGVVTGLRSMTPLAVLAWAAYAGWIHLSGSRLAFLNSASIWVVILFAAAAFGEFVADLLPRTPARTSLLPLFARIVIGTFAGAALAVAGAASLWLGALAGAIGAIVGTFAGYRARVGLVKALRVPDAVIAIPEDLLAVGFALLLVSRF